MEIRLQKALAQAGLASRRKAEELIEQGRVEVNGAIVREHGSKVDPGRDLIRVDGKLLSESESKVYYVLFKPSGMVTTLSDPQGRPTIRDCLEGIEERVFAVGRLDWDAEGALVVTNDGDLANRLMHPRYQVPKTYLAKVKGSPDEASIAKLRSGVRLEDGEAKPDSVAIEQSADKNTWIRLVVSEGRPHLVKRMCAAIGHPVVRLFRPQYAGIGVEGLAPGKFRALTSVEIEQLKQAGPSSSQSSMREPIKLPPRRHRSQAQKPSGTMGATTRPASDRGSAASQRYGQQESSRDRRNDARSGKQNSFARFGEAADSERSRGFDSYRKSSEDRPSNSRGGSSGERAFSSSKPRDGQHRFSRPSTGFGKGEGRWDRAESRGPRRDERKSSGWGRAHPGRSFDRAESYGGSRSDFTKSEADKSDKGSTGGFRRDRADKRSTGGFKRDGADKRSMGGFKRDGADKRSTGGFRRDGADKRSTGGFKRDGADKRSTGGFKRDGADKRSTGGFKRDGADKRSMGSFKRDGADKRSTGGFKRDGADKRSTGGFKRDGADKRSTGGFKRDGADKRSAGGFKRGGSGKRSIGGFNKGRAGNRSAGGPNRSRR